METFYWQRKLSPLLKTMDENQKPAAHSLIVEIAGRRVDQIGNIVSAYHGRIQGELSLFPALIVELPGSGIEELARYYWVHKIWRNLQAYALLDVAVPTVGASKVQQMGYTGNGVVVAVIDTGIAPHPDLVADENRILAWNDLVGEKSEPYDDNGHGTHVAGIIAGNGHSSKGRYVGMAPEARLVGVKVLDGEGSGALSNVVAGIEWCLKNKRQLNVKVINLSLGTTAQESYRTDPLCRAVAAAWRSGVVVCAAAGNTGPDPRSINSPGISPAVITVGNIDDRNTLDPKDDRLNQTSSGGPTIDDLPKPDLVAPGTEITSLSNRGGYRALTGTSMAAPMVAGAVAQILQKYPQWSPERIKQVLRKNARNKGLGPNLQGAGELNVANLFEEQRSTVSVTSRNSFQKAITYQILKMLISKMSPGFTEIPRWLDRKTEGFVINVLDSLF
ncbi:serine protease AprX [Hydrogenispora ethanolica]|jgi:serine protease AprX|uniref:Serine protease AprX n=1 Tax=Hydrogenispora ethanolica TaxID=1082276 RepID=A0A4R1RVL9_HYDET|nr:S8 family peptidase [Hydrogenispora ethanolica]TCL69992.1 serine protease AprX [Hydrogenispora ethanolica]